MTKSRRKQAEPEPTGRGCDHPGCVADGYYRAPRSRDDIHRYYWFCLDHVRAYNQSWDYCAGMSQTEIESLVRADVVGWRPSWPLGIRGIRSHRLVEERLRAMYETLHRYGDRYPESEPPPRPRAPLTPEEKALAVFDLEEPVEAADIKARYKELVKRHHPDANGGDKDAEEKLKTINNAYSTLKQHHRV